MVLRGSYTRTHVHTHKHAQRLLFDLNRHDSGARASSSIRHMVYTGSQVGIEALFIEASVYGKQILIVCQPGILLVLAIHSSANTHTYLKTIFQFLSLRVTTLKQGMIACVCTFKKDLKFNSIVVNIHEKCPKLCTFPLNQLIPLKNLIFIRGTIINVTVQTHFLQLNFKSLDNDDQNIISLDLIESEKNEL